MGSASNPDFMNGVPQLLILQLLSGEPMYGYQIVKTIKQRSQGELSVSEGSIYPLLHKLEEEGSLVSFRREVKGRERYYYELTSQGKEKLRELKEEWNSVVHGVQQVLGGDHEQPVF